MIGKINIFVTDQDQPDLSMRNSQGFNAILNRRSTLISMLNKSLPFICRQKIIELTIKSKADFLHPEVTYFLKLTVSRQQIQAVIKVVNML